MYQTEPALRDLRARKRPTRERTDTMRLEVDYIGIARVMQMDCHASVDSVRLQCIQSDQHNTVT